MENEIEIKAIVERVKTQLSEFYNGDPWVTENFIDKVLSINANDAIKKTNGHSHSVAQLAGHIIAWRNFAIQKLTGNNDYDIEDDSPANWPVTTDWPAICKQFELCHNQLLYAINNMRFNRWSSKVPGRNYSFLYLINGIIEHDYYHYGQIGSLLAAIHKKQ